MYTRLGGLQGRIWPVRKILLPPGFDSRTVQQYRRRCLCPPVRLWAVIYWRFRKNVNTLCGRNAKLWVLNHVVYQVTALLKKVEVVRSVFYFRSDWIRFMEFLSPFVMFRTACGHVESFYHMVRLSVGIWNLRARTLCVWGVVLDRGYFHRCYYVYLNKFVNSLVPTSFANGCRQLLTRKKEVRLSLCLIKHHAMTVYGRMEVGYGSFTHSAVHGSERWAVRFHRFARSQTALCIHWSGTSNVKHLRVYAICVFVTSISN